MGAPSGEAVTGDMLFSRNDPEIGRLWLRRLVMPEDIPVVHSWVTREYASYWGLAGRSVDQVRDAYVEIARHAEVYLGFHHDKPAFLVECYSPAEHEVGQHYACGEGDRGMHVLVGPPDVPVPGFTWAVFRTVMDFLFSDPGVARVVVEPDVRNQKIHALNRRAGFRYQRVVRLSTKVGHLAFCTREQYRIAIEHVSAPAAKRGLDERSTIEHLQPEIWTEVNAALVRKAIAEFAHERLLDPRLEEHGAEWHRFVLAASAGVEYRFRARSMALNHWDIERTSLEKTVQGEPVPVDGLDFILEFAEPLGISPANLPVYLEEITSTLYGAAYKRAHERFSASDLLHASFQEREAAMTEGHPAFVANSGRVGFDAVDYRRYAPEAASPVHLVWLAAHRRCAETSIISGLSYEGLLEEELGEEMLRGFRAQLVGQGLNPDDYIFMPVHPWQWYEKLSLGFAADIAARNLVCLGTGQDSYQAQQSIRTFFNTSTPSRRYIKTALSVLNMGFMRGLSADYMRSTPAINEWVAALVGDDAYLRARRFGILREVASCGYRKAVFESALPKTSPYRKMLAALFRESPVPMLRKGEHLMTMAALLHRDSSGTALLPQLIAASGLGTDAWVARYLGCYLTPLLHCFYHHELTFMPHGENVILVLDQFAPVAVWMKDIAEEVALLTTERQLPELVRRIAIPVPDDVKTLSIFTDVFDGFLRFMSAVLISDRGYSEERFWLRVAECIAAYQHEHPELEESFKRYDLFAPEFGHSCLNRLQLRNNRHMLDLTDPVQGLAFAGTLKNPIAPFQSLAPQRHEGVLPEARSEHGTVELTRLG